MRNRAILTAAVLAAVSATASDRSSGEGDLSPITASDWNYDRAAHLLERAGFGGTPEEIQQLAKMTPLEAVRHLVRYQSVENPNMPEFKGSGIFPSDDFVPPVDGNQGGVYTAIRNGGAFGIKLEKKPGTMWAQPLIDYLYYLRFSNNGEIGRVQSYFATRMLVTRRPLEEKLALFWHGHFATENDKVRDYRKMMAQWDKYRGMGNGNFGELLLAMSGDPAMLIYLDGQKNVKGHPNENYAREILELFSLGVGNYTEKDIQEAARAFSGWGLDGNKFIERAELHDDGQKTFLGKTGNFDGPEIVKIVLEQPACARFISRKLYRYFVRDDKSLSFLRDIAKTAEGSSAKVREAVAGYSTPVSYGSESSVAQLSTDLKKVAALIHADFPTRIYYVSMSGFDTHAGQAGAQQGLLMYVADALEGFLKDVKRIGRAGDVAMMMFTEFGRRVAENQSGGTDHGTATPMYIMGEKVKPGLYGTYPNLQDLDSNGDLRMAVDFRSVYATMIQEWMGFKGVKDILKGDFKPLGTFA